MADTGFSMAIEPCAILQAEGWQATLPAFEAELARQLGGALPAAFGEAVPLPRFAGEEPALRPAAPLIPPRLRGRGTAEGGGGGASTALQRTPAEWQVVRIAPRRLWFIANAGAQLRCSVDPELGCLVSLSEGRMRLRLSGPHLADILSACVAIDWSGVDAKPGRAWQTAFHHVPVLLLKTAANACDMLVPRSFAQSLGEWIAEVAAPYGTATVTT